MIAQDEVDEKEMQRILLADPRESVGYLIQCTSFIPCLPERLRELPSVLGKHQEPSMYILDCPLSHFQFRPNRTDRFPLHEAPCNLETPCKHDPFTRHQHEFDAIAQQALFFKGGEHGRKPFLEFALLRNKQKIPCNFYHAGIVACVEKMSIY